MKGGKLQVSEVRQTLAGIHNDNLVQMDVYLTQSSALENKSQKNKKKKKRKEEKRKKEKKSVF